MPEVKTLNIPGWEIKARIPDKPGHHPILILLHGWQGDENSMWVFAQKIPEHYLVLAPRGLFSAPGGGYSWVDWSDEYLPGITHFSAGISAMVDLLALRPGVPNQAFDQVSLMGFSQGAALAYSFALLFPNRVRSVIGLAGFLPEGAQEYVTKRPWINKPLFISHGTYDDIIPIERARHDVDILRDTGAVVQFCEAPVGHKLGIDCLREVDGFFDHLDALLP